MTKDYKYKKKETDPVFTGFLRKQRNMQSTPNKPRRIKAGVRLGERYTQGHVTYEIVEEYGALMVRDLVTDDLHFVHEFDWEEMERTV